MRGHFRQERGNPFSAYFGRLYEQYVGAVLKSAFPAEDVVSEPEYGRPGERKRGPDWIVLDREHQTALLFECRTSGLVLEFKGTAEETVLLDDLKRILIDTAAKYPQKIKDIKSDAAGVDVTGISRFVPIIITHESAYFEPALRDLASSELTIDAREYRHIDVSDLETLAAWNGRQPMSDILAAWHNAYAIQPIQLGHFLNKSATEHDLGLLSRSISARHTHHENKHLCSDLAV